MSSDKTRAERIEEAARAVMETSGKFMSDTQHLNLGQALALPPDPPRGDEKLRELRSTFVRQLKDAQHGRRSKSNLGLDHSIAEIDRLLAAAPKEPEPAESPAEPEPDKRGLFNKFTVTRNDGTDKPGGKHDGCDYFVLDLMHDMHAKAAILAYADACERDLPQLAKDLRDRMGWAQPPAEPPLDDEAAIEAWGREAQRVVLEYTPNLPEIRDVFRVTGAEIDTAVTIMRRLAREKADLRAKLAAAESALVARHGGEPLALLAELDEARAKLAAAHEQLRCPDCGCATPEEAEAGECGCDSPVCSVEVTTTVAKELCDVAKKLAAAKARIAAIVEWTHQYGASLCPFGNYTDSFGDGMRAAKEQVSRLADLGKGGV